ncbi:hypothetical protein [Rhodococcus sp. NPDC056516]|uniref:hypothetical protein n=1 Tax=Rhodococcus sp. NPDC056516 TaxID=3345847 RepID=UPI0036723181
MAPRTDLLAWLLDSDPAIRWQVERDLLNEAPTVWAATRASIATNGFGARLLSVIAGPRRPMGGWGVLPVRIRLCGTRSSRTKFATLDGNNLDAQLLA